MFDEDEGVCNWCFNMCQKCGECEEGCKYNLKLVKVDYFSPRRRLVRILKFCMGSSVTKILRFNPKKLKQIKVCLGMKQLIVVRALPLGHNVVATNSLSLLFLRCWVSK